MHIFAENFKILDIISFKLDSVPRVVKHLCVLLCSVADSDPDVLVGSGSGFQNKVESGSSL